MRNHFRKISHRGFWTYPTIAKALKINLYDAQYLLELMLDAPYDISEAFDEINRLLDCSKPWSYGVECLRPEADGYDLAPIEYVNRGEVYEPTVIWFEQKWYVMSIGDLIEAHYFQPKRSWPKEER